jgi:hypothetical protein
MATINNGNSGLGIYSLLAGFAYIIVGCAQIITGIIGIESPIIPGDFFQGAVLIIIGLVFVMGFVDMRKGDSDWDAYLTIGSLLAGIIFVLYMFMLLSNGLGWALGFEDWLEWTPIEQFQPGLWLFVFALPGIYLASKKYRSAKD